MIQEPAPSVKDGVVIVANDKIIEWLLPFLESYKATNASIDLHLIPYDENVRATRRAAEIYGAHWVGDDMLELDRLARRLYPLSPYRRRRLRKLQALAMPLDRVIYLDVDTILFRNLRPVFDGLRPGESEFIIASCSDDYVYNGSHVEHEFLKNVKLFNDGFFATSRNIISLRDFNEVIDRDEKLFHSVRKRGGLYAQPLVNFVVHRRNLQVRSLQDCVPRASNESFYKATHPYFREDGPVDCYGREIYFAHWAGAVTKPRGRIFDQAWQDYARKAAARMTQ